MSTPAASGPTAPEVIAGLKEVTLWVSLKAPLAYISYLLQVFFLFAPMGKHPYLLNCFFTDASSCQ